MRAVNATSAALLGLLRTGPLTGYELTQAATQQLGDFWSVTRSQVYRELSAMADAGLLEPGPSGKRDRRPYALTDAGREAFTTWLRADPGPDVVRIPLLLRLAFADGMDPARLAEVAAAQRAEHAARLEAYEQLAASLPQMPPTLAFGLRYERAVLAWFDEDLGAGQ